MGVPERWQGPSSTLALRGQNPGGSIHHVLFVTYNGLLEPLGLRQGLSYLEALRDDFRITVLSFEKTSQVDDPGRWKAIEGRVADRGIGWIPLRYHRRPSLPATLYDVWAGGHALAGLHAKEPVDLVHARGYVPAMIGLRARRRFGPKLLFDIRGLLADEYVDAGVWKRGSVREKLTRRAERRLLRGADAIVTLTEAVAPEVESRLEASGRATDPFWKVIPCCVDLSAFRPDPKARAEVRARLGIGEEPLAVYAGSVGTWYPVLPLAQLFAELRDVQSDAHLLLLLNGPDRELRSALRTEGVPDGRVHTVYAKPEDAPAYLAAADAGIALVRPSPSKRASSPTKIAEYLACGLPVVLNFGVGDNDALRGEESIVTAASFERSALREAASALAQRMHSVPAQSARDLAARRFDLIEVGVARYRALYREILALSTEGT